MFQKGDRVEVVKDKFIGRTGVIKRLGTTGIFDGWCYLTLDLKPRERTEKTIFIEQINLIKMATKTTTPTVDFKNISIKDIEADINQPRKFFDEHSLAELAASVKANSVLQPIMVRPNGKKFLLVYGERRFKAALVIGLKEIPAIIRELSDAEALDIQITENLQRKDVHPMEEAVAFKRLLDAFTIEDIALKVGKSESFVAKRIQLTELVEDAQQIFFLDKITISEAVRLARLEPETQQEILNEILPNDWKEDNDFVLGNYGRSIGRYIENKQFDLSDAIFDISEKSLYKEAGACVGCKFNSASTPLLFDEQDGGDKICSKPSCFQTKTDRQEKMNLESLASDPTKIVFCPHRHLTDDAKRKVDIAKEMGINVLDRNDCEVISMPDEILFFDKWKEEKYYEDEDDAEEDIQKQYNEYVDELKEEYKKYEELVAAGDVINAVDVFTQKEVTIRITATAKNEVTAATGNAGHNATKDEIYKIKSREQRAKELDAEKVQLQVNELLKKSTEFTDPKHKPKGLHLSQTEIVGAIIALFDAGSYTFRKYVAKLYDFGDHYNPSAKDVENLLKSGVTEFAINDLLRHFMIDKLDKPMGNRFINGNALMIHELAKEQHPLQVKKIELEQQEIAESRGERVAKRIKALEDKLIMN